MGSLTTKQERGLYLYVGTRSNGIPGPVMQSVGRIVNIMAHTIHYSGPHDHDRATIDSRFRVRSEGWSAVASVAFLAGVRNGTAHGRQRSTTASMRSFVKSLVCILHDFSRESPSAG
jgi:hypothetical protein